MIALLPNCAYLSETSRMIEIHRALLARGAGVCVATHGGTYERLLRDAGVPYSVVGRGWDEERCVAFRKTTPGIGPPSQSMWTDEEIHDCAVAEASFFRERGVSVAVTGWTLTALLSTRLAGIPLVTEHAGSFVPPVFEREIVPAPSTVHSGPVSRLPRRLQRKLVNTLLPRTRGYTHGFNRVAARLGVEGVPSVAALLLGDLTLVTDTPEVLGIPPLELEAWRPRSPRRYRMSTRIRYAGPLFARLDVPVPERVEKVLAGDAPVIYVAITSSSAELVRGVVEALRGVQGRIIVAGTAHDLHDLEGDRVMVEAVLPSHRIMPRVALAVTSGGQGSVQSAMASGVPLLGIPLQTEQDLNVALVERLGAACLVPEREAVTPRIAQVARQMMADSGYAAAAKRLREVFAQVDGAGRAAEAVLDIEERGVAAVDPS